MSRIIEIGGIDGSGKSTVISNIRQELEKKGLSVYLPPTAVKLSQLYPQSLDERKKWYLSASPDAIARANLEGAAKRNEISLACNSSYVILDRGYRTTLASAAARLEQRGYNPAQVEDLLSHLSAEYSFRPIEDKHLLLTVSLEEAMKRNGNAENDYFAQYLLSFSKNLTRQWRGEEQYMIDALQPKADVACQALEKILY